MDHSPISAFPGERLSDDELTELALAADPDQPLGSDATPWTAALAPVLLPEWYMPPVAATIHRRWLRLVVLVLVLGFVFIEAAGLCSTYGSLVLP